MFIEIKIVNPKGEELFRFHEEVSQDKIQFNYSPGVFEALGSYEYSKEHIVNITFPDVKNSLLNISGFTHVFIKAYINCDPHFAFAKVESEFGKFHSNSIDYERLDIEKTNVLIHDCEIKEMNVGIAENHSRFSSDEIDIRLVDSIDIREVNINWLRIFRDVGTISSRQSIIDKLSFEHLPTIKRLHIWHNSIVNFLNCFVEASEIEVSKSIVNNWLFGEKTIVSSLKLEYSHIELAIGATLETFVEKNYDVYDLVLASATRQRNHELYYETKYEYMVHIGENATSNTEKFWNKFLDVTTGYGYKPFRTIQVSSVIYFLSAMLYFISDAFYALSNYGFTILGSITLKQIAFKIGEVLYFSAITFTTTGYGDMTQNVLSKAIASLEAVAGIIMMPLFIFALTKRYGSWGD